MVKQAVLTGNSILREEEKVTRRDALKTAWLAVGGLAAIETGVIGLSYVQPRLAEGEFGGMMLVGEVDTFPPGSVTHISNGRFNLSRLEDGGFLAIYQRCTHLGCSVPWDQAQEAFVCPCHNSRFTALGEAASPPAPRPLDLFPVQIEGGQVFVDTGAPFQRDKFDSSQVVYP